MLAVVKDDSVGMAMLLFLLETLMASALLVVRLSASRRAMRDDHEARRRLGEAIRMVQFFVLPFSLGCAMLLGVVTFIEVERGAPPSTWLHISTARNGWCSPCSRARASTR